MKKTTNRLKELREGKGKSGTEIAELLGISPQYYYDLEKGNKRLNETWIRKLMAIYKVPSDYLLGYSHDLNAGSDTTSDLDEEWSEVTGVLRRSGKKLTPEDKRRIARIIKAAIPEEDEENGK
jgi:transcriptional regulator with XRE-family HTH domain